jgi:hypothetical protein
MRVHHRLRELKRAHGNEVTIFSSHDVEEFERLAGHSARACRRKRCPVPLVVTRALYDRLSEPRTF